MFSITVSYDLYLFIIYIIFLCYGIINTSCFEYITYNFICCKVVRNLSITDFPNAFYA